MASGDVVLDVSCAAKYTRVEDNPDIPGTSAERWVAEFSGSMPHAGATIPNLWNTDHKVTVTGTIPPATITDTYTSPATVFHPEQDVPFEREKQYRVQITEV
jgi:hypothetical protein